MRCISNDVMHTLPGLVSFSDGFINQAHEFVMENDKWHGKNERINFTNESTTLTYNYS